MENDKGSLNLDNVPPELNDSNMYHHDPNLQSSSERRNLDTAHFGQINSSSKKIGVNRNSDIYQQ